MRVFHLISSGGFYGAERVIITLSETLNRMGHPTTIGVFHNSHAPNIEVATDARLRSLPVESIPCNGRIDWGSICSLHAVLERIRPDILHAHGYKADIYGYLAARGCRLARISTCHTWYDNDLSVYLYGVLDRQVLRKFDMTVAVSEEVLQRLRRAHIPESRIQIIANGIDVSAFSNAVPTLHTELQPGKPVVGLVGRLAPEKGIRYFLDAAALVLQSHPDTVFVVVGDGPERANLLQHVRGLGIEGNVVFAGKREDMPGVYASLDILVSSSLDEGLPMTLLEALSASRTVVATAVGAVPDIIRHGETGLLVEPGDAQALAVQIIRVLDDRELREIVAKNGHELVVRQHSAEAMTNRYLRLYADVLRTQVAE